MTLEADQLEMMSLNNQISYWGNKLQKLEMVSHLIVGAGMALDSGDIDLQAQFKTLEDEVQKKIFHCEERRDNAKTKLWRLQRE